jgi:hypothetical protein
MKHRDRADNHLYFAVLVFIAAAVWLGLLPLLSGPPQAAGQVDTGQIRTPLVSTGETKERLTANLPTSTAAVLYDQTANIAPISSASNRLGPFNAFNTEAADDFIVPANRIWTVRTLVVFGVYSLFGPASSVNVAIYSDLNGLPGPAVCIHGSLVPMDTAGDFVITLPSPCVLSSGHYWVEVQANISGSQRRWFWTEQTVQTNFESVWRNPGGGFGTGCTTFMPRLSTCHVGADPDLSFQILGEEALAFDYCVQDDSTGNILQLNSGSGDYLFTNCHGVILVGKGVVTKKGNIITLQHNASDRRVLARIDGSSKRATGSIQLFSQGLAFGLTDRNISNNICLCA